MEIIVMLAICLIMFLPVLIAYSNKSKYRNGILYVFIGMFLISILMKSGDFSNPHYIESALSLGGITVLIWIVCLTLAFVKEDRK